MGFSIAKVETEQRVPFVDGYGTEVTHVFRGVTATEFQRLLAEGQRNTVNATEGATAEQMEAAKEANQMAWFALWDQLILRVEGYEELDGLEGADLKRAFRGEGSIFEPLGKQRHEIVCDLLRHHVRGACEVWVGLNTARLTFRYRDEANAVGRAAR